MTELAHVEHVVVHASPQAAYDLLSDVTRTGEWSPQCRACWWDEGAGPEVGAWFTGRNETPERTWETRCLVVAADPGREFAWQVGGTCVRWGFVLEPVDGGTRITQSWAFLPDGLAMFAERFGDDAPVQVEVRARAAHEGMPLSLQAVRRILEQG